MGERPDKVLVVLMEGRRAAVVAEDAQGRLGLTYESDWRDTRGATPLSLSMPLVVRTHGDAVVRGFLWGLLPDSEQVLERWAQRYQVSARSPFALLRHVGEDCAGAAQLAVPDRVDALLGGEGGVEWLEEADVAELLRALRRDPAAWDAARTGQFTLAGAQAKTALHGDVSTGRWGSPWGAVPTTHILKPAVKGFDDHDLNEHLCLETARALGLRAAHSSVAPFEDERAIVVERYDRLRSGDGCVRRVHQEDLCQALGLPPTSKYQNEGGPAPEQIVELLRDSLRPNAAAAEGVGLFVDALAFNWILAGTDAHAKNYSLLLSGGRVRLAPLYDVASALPYEEMHLPKLRAAMSIGGEYRLAGVSGRHWRRLAEQTGLEPDVVVERVSDLAARAPDGLASAAGVESVQALGSGLPARLLDRVATRAEECRTLLRKD